MIFALFAGKNAIFSNIDEGGGGISTSLFTVKAVDSHSRRELTLRIKITDRTIGNGNNVNHFFLFFALGKFVTQLSSNRKVLNLIFIKKKLWGSDIIAIASSRNLTRRTEKVLNLDYV